LARSATTLAVTTVTLALTLIAMGSAPATLTLTGTAAVGSAVAAEGRLHGAGDQRRDPGAAVLLAVTRRTDR
jgi:hypothetical protein